MRICICSQKQLSSATRIPYSTRIWNWRWISIRFSGKCEMNFRNNWGYRIRNVKVEALKKFKLVNSSKWWECIWLLR